MARNNAIARLLFSALLLTHQRSALDFVLPLFLRSDLKAMLASDISGCAGFVSKRDFQPLKAPETQDRSPSDVHFELLFRSFVQLWPRSRSQPCEWFLSGRRPLNCATVSVYHMFSLS
jgi:hypothetical protein